MGSTLARAVHGRHRARVANHVPPRGLLPPRASASRLTITSVAGGTSDQARPGYRRSMEVAPTARPRPGPGSPGAGAPWFSRLAATLSARVGRRRAPDLPDAAIAAACFAAFTLPVLAGAADGAGSRLTVAAFGVAAAVPLTVRRRWPLTVLAVLVAVYAGSTLAGIQFTPFVSSAGPNLAIAMFAVADRYERRVSLLAYGLAAVCTWGVLAAGISLHPGVDQDAVQAGAMIPGWFLGDSVRTRRRYRQSLALEAQRQALESEARIRAEERLRLSRDVHDVVSHSLSMIAVRSGVARLVLDDKPGAARDALAAIETASRAALDEVRLLLREIRAPAGAAATSWPATGDLPELVRQFREDGLDLAYRRTGEQGHYGEAVELSAYRIAQEALTNVARHAPAACAALQVDYEPARLTVTVTDDGPARVGQPGTGPGIGVHGMRERALLHGGEFRAGPTPGGGFEVVAVLPGQAVPSDPAGGAS
jgi:signal transduction histidine kinase